MADNNNSQNNQKPGLSWSQPSSTQSTPNNSGNQSAPKMNGGNNRPPMQPQSSNSTWWIAGAVVVVLALIVWAFVAARRADNTTGDAGQTATTTDTNVTTIDENSSTTTTTTTMPSTMPGMTASTSGMGAAMPTSTVPVGMSADASQLTVPTPQVAGMQVTVSNIVVANPTWVVVYEDTNGKPGNALGAALFVAGRTSGAVDLLRATVPGQTYFATEAQDTDGSHTFSLTGDAPALDSSGQQIWVQLSTN